MDFDNTDYGEYDIGDIDDEYDESEKCVDDYMVKLSKILNWVDKQEIASVVDADRYNSFIKLAGRVRRLFPKDKYKYGESFKVNVDVRSGVGMICVYIKDQEFFGSDVSEFADICLLSGDVEFYSLTSGVTRIGFAQYKLFNPIGGSIIDR
ncbi:MAG: hypothetical protein ACI4HZ_08050 [Ruminococcus sp.]